MGSRQPPQLQTMKMKKTTVWAMCRRWRLTSSSGWIRSMAAPVVPIRLARMAPTARKRALVRGWAGRSPAMRMPPLMVYRLNSRRMNGPYSPKTAREEHVAGQGEVRPADRRQHHVRRRPLGLQRKRPPEQVIGKRHCRQRGRHGEPVRVALPPRGRCRQQRKHGDAQQQQRKGQDRPVGWVLDMIPATTAPTGLK